MQRFATLLYQLALARTARDKQRLLSAYLTETPDPERGYALAVIAGDVTLPKATPSLIHRLAEKRLDTELFELSREFTKDPAETLCLLWPDAPPSRTEPSLTDIISMLGNTPKADLPDTLANMMDILSINSRWAMLSIMKRRAFHGVTPHMAKEALSTLNPGTLPIIEEAWHPAAPPYTHLFDWLAGDAPAPPLTHPARFRPMQLPIQMSSHIHATMDSHTAEWRCDGADVQLVATGSTVYLYSNTGNDISHILPPSLRSLPIEVSLDATLVLHGKDGALLPAEDLETTLSKTSRSTNFWSEHSVQFYAHDILSYGDRDLRDLPYSERRNLMETHLSILPDKLILTPSIPFDDLESLKARQAYTPEPAFKGIRLKARSSPYTPGARSNAIIDWPPDPYTIFAALLYAKRSSRHNGFDELTFGVWSDEGELVRIGKAPLSGSSQDEETLAAYIKSNTIERFGPVRTVTANVDTSLVLRVTFHRLIPTTRHKAGYQLSGATINAILPMESPQQANSLSTLIDLTGMVRQSRDKQF